MTEDILCQEVAIRTVSVMGPNLNCQMNLALVFVSDEIPFFGESR